jgi:hypothetical protein
VTIGVRSNWIGVIDYWNEDLFYTVTRQKMVNMELPKAMLDEIKQEIIAD